MTEKQLYLSDCIYFDIWQDTDDYGREIAPPVLYCDKEHNNCHKCEDYRSAIMTYDCKHHIGQYCIKYQTLWFLCSNCPHYTKKELKE